LYSIKKTTRTNPIREVKFILMIIIDPKNVIAKLLFRVFFVDKIVKVAKHPKKIQAEETVCFSSSP